MADNGCEQALDRKLDGYFGCGVYTGQILAPMLHGADGCGEVVDRKLDG